MLYLKENKTPLSAVVFDLGNVLFDYNPRRFMFELGIDQKYYDRLEEIFPNSPEWLELDKGMITEDEFLARALLKEPMLKKEIITYHKHWPEHCPAVTHNVAAFYDIKAMGVKTYVLSNYQPRSFAYAEEHNIFLHDFDGTVISCRCGLCKPDPAIYKLLIDTYALDAAHTVFFDDLQVNIDAARAAGLLGVVLPPCGHVADYLIFE